KRFGYDASTDAAAQAVLQCSPACRDLYLGNTWPLLPLKHVREDLSLKSTWFTVTTTGDRVVLSGRGFGHGVGLCQEGSMAMARYGASYTDILHHYFTGVHLVDLSTIDFFRDVDTLPGYTGGGPRPR
ncbi:MAG TPA: hypothetical protein PK760_11070, partial [Flavobacteriales bacterium]|nr:hypothetical protein [Flavobacteriales bacterium]